MYTYAPLVCGSFLFSPVRYTLFPSRRDTNNFIRAIIIIIDMIVVVRKVEFQSAG